MRKGGIFGDKRNVGIWFYLAAYLRVYIFRATETGCIGERDGDGAGDAERLRFPLLDQIFILSRFM